MALMICSVSSAWAKKSGLINPETGRDYLTCEVEMLTQEQMDEVWDLQSPMNWDFEAQDIDRLSLEDQSAFIQAALKKRKPWAWIFSKPAYSANQFFRRAMSAISFMEKNWGDRDHMARHTGNQEEANNVIHEIYEASYFYRLSEQQTETLRTSAFDYAQSHFSIHTVNYKRSVYVDGAWYSRTLPVEKDYATEVRSLMYDRWGR